VSIITHQRHPAHKRFLAGLLGIPLLLAAGCQTPQTGTVAPPATGMIGQPAAYGSWATPPQGAAYPPTVSAPPMQVAGAAPPPMPGPATQWQAAAPAVPAAPAAPAGNNWSWSQPSTGAPPSMQQYGNQLQAQANRLVIVVLHDLALAARFADRIILMQAGRIAADGPPNAVLTAERLGAVFGVEIVTVERDGTRAVLPWAAR
jgi:hypothetical protein